MVVGNSGAELESIELTQLKGNFRRYVRYNTLISTSDFWDIVLSFHWMECVRRRRGVGILRTGHHPPHPTTNPHPSPSLPPPPTPPTPTTTPSQPHPNPTTPPHPPPPSPPQQKLSSMPLFHPHSSMWMGLNCIDQTGTNTVEGSWPMYAVTSPTVVVPTLKML